MTEPANAWPRSLLFYGGVGAGFSMHVKKNHVTVSVKETSHPAKAECQSRVQHGISSEFLGFTKDDIDH